ncbi:hypothetical protein ACTFIU_003338 [Dictyostelium citrinum]
MDWQTYIDEQLLPNGLCSAAIISSNDGSIWAQSPKIGLNKAECDSLIALFKKPEEVFSKGVVVGGIKYMGIKGDQTSIYGKRGATGCVLVKTTKCIIIGVYDEKMHPANATNSVEKLGDYLRDDGN